MALPWYGGKTQDDGYSASISSYHEKVILVGATTRREAMVRLSAYIMRGSKILARDCTIASRRVVAPTNQWSWHDFILEKGLDRSNIYSHISVTLNK